MTTPVITETIPFGDPTKVAGLVRLYAVAGGGGTAYTNAGTPLTIGGTIRVSFTAAGVLKADDGVTALTLNPNSGASADAISTPAGTMWQYEIRFPGDKDPVVRFLNVPDGAGPYNVADILSDAPASLATPGSVVYVDSILNTQLDLTALPPAAAAAGTDTVVVDQSNTLTAMTLNAVAAFSASGGSVAANTISGNWTGSAAAPTANALGASTIPARLASGNIVAATGAQVGGLISVSDLLAPTGALTWNQALAIGDGTAAHGKVSIGASIIGSISSYFVDTGDAQPAVLLGSALGVRFGPGGATVPDCIISRTGTTALSIDAASGVAITGSITLSDAKNIIVNSTTGTKIGTATTQKLGFFNATPIVQPANTTDLRAALINLGLYATGGATPLDLNGGALSNGTQTFTDATNMVFGSTTGTKIGTATTQKIGFFNSTPIVQPANTTDLRAALINLGLYATGGATPLDLNLGSLTAGTTTIVDGTAAHGSAVLGASVIGSSVACNANTADTQPAVILGSALGLRFGPGGSTVADCIISRTGTTALSIDAASGVAVTGTITLTDAKNIVIGSTTGTKIGTATTQKLAFFNSTPIVQPAGTTDLRAALINLGLYATGGATPLDLNGGALTTASHTFADAANIIVNSTTGTKIGTAVGQKLGFWNATPVIQQASASQAAVAVTGSTTTTPFGYTTSAQADAIVTLVNAIRLALVNTGIIKGAA